MILFDNLFGLICFFSFFFKQKTAYEMSIGDWSSDVCSSDLAERFSTVELNTTGYRLPGEAQFERWAEQTPPGFRFAPKLAGNRPRLLAEFAPRVRALGDRLGPTRVQLISSRDEGMIELVLG